MLQNRDQINGLLRQTIVKSAVPWGLEVQRFEMKDVELPVAMQQVHGTTVIMIPSDFSQPATRLTEYMKGVASRSRRGPA